MLKIGGLWSLMVLGMVLMLVALDQLGGAKNTVLRLFPSSRSEPAPATEPEEDPIAVHRPDGTVQMIPPGSLPEGLPVCGYNDPDQLCVVVDWKPLPGAAAAQAAEPAAQ
jgi:hypothetical protein